MYARARCPCNAFVRVTPVADRGSTAVHGPRRSLFWYPSPGCCPSSYSRGPAFAAVPGIWQPFAKPRVCETPSRARNIARFPFPFEKRELRGVPDRQSRIALPLRTKAANHNYPLRITCLPAAAGCHLFCPLNALLSPDTPRLCSRARSRLAHLATDETESKPPSPFPTSSAHIK